jgi:hypothetical protein
LIGAKRTEIKRFRDSAFYAPELNFDTAQAELTEKVDEQKILEQRQKILSSDTRTDEDSFTKQKYFNQSESLLSKSRITADLIIAAFFDGTTKKEREERLKEYAGLLLLSEQEGLSINPAAEIVSGDMLIAAQLSSRTQKQYKQRMAEYGSELIKYESSSKPDEKIFSISEQLRTGNQGILPFHWEVEFLEVFSERENPGFDIIIGNPPFAGKNTITVGNAEGYLELLKERYAESHGNSDLVAYFFRRAFELLRSGGALGLIATNTIAQGDTRSTGLRFICNGGGLIYNATRRYKWPGLAAVVVSVVHIWKQEEGLGGKSV